MAKPDWGALQDQFLAEHAKTDISPKDWCEEQELNYTSARRYITKPPDSDCSGQLKLATALEFFQYRFSDSFGGNPPL
uniref:hypothetical protein n=1 Tax=Citrobacter freundii TaxID=546 RepID=UPI001F1497EB|nr:hypothetical protein [Citrobacter freundii]